LCVAVAALISGHNIGILHSYDPTKLLIWHHFVRFLFHTRGGKTYWQLAFHLYGSVLNIQRPKAFWCRTSFLNLKIWFLILFRSWILVSFIPRSWWSHQNQPGRCPSLDFMVFYFSFSCFSTCFCFFLLSFSWGSLFHLEISY
jgi:hypothetical protein